MDIKDLSYSAQHEFCSCLRIGLLKQMKKDIDDKIKHRISTYEEILKFLQANFPDLYRYDYEKERLEQLKKIKPDYEDID